MLDEAIGIRDTPQSCDHPPALSSLYIWGTLEAKQTWQWRCVLVPTSKLDVSLVFKPATQSLGLVSMYNVTC